MKLTSSLVILATLATFCAAQLSPNGNYPVKISLVVNASGKDVFSGGVLTRGHDVTTPSGGTHKCDGTNNGANPKPGATPTSALSDTAKLYGFTFDGQWFDSFEDFFISEIGGVSCDWVLKRNGKVTDVGGCQEELKTGDEVSWTC